MPDLPEVREKFVADTSGYSRPLRDAANDADKFGRNNDQAALAARKMGLAAKDAADKAARAQKDAADAAEKLARGEISADEAAQAEAKSLREMERAAIKAAEAQNAAGKAADKAAKNFKQMGRDATLAAAAMHLAALKEVGDAKSYNEALTRLKKTHGDLKGTALETFKTMEKEGNAAYQGLTAAGEAAGKAGPLWVVPIANAVANLPAIATVAGDGIVLGLGAGLAAVGLMAQAKTADIKRTFSSLKKDVGKDLTEISAPFHETLLHIAADAGNAFHQLSPALQTAFAEMAPAVSHFSSNLASALSGPRMQAAITSIGTGFSKVLDSLGPATASAIGDIADGIKSIGDAAAQNPQALSSLVTGVGQLTKYSLEGVSALMRYKTQVDAVVHAVAGQGPAGFLKFVTTLKDGTQALLGQNHGLQIAEQTFPTFNQQTTAAAAATGHLMTAQQAAALSSKQMADALQNLTAVSDSAFDSETAYQRALIAANAQAKTNNYGIDTNTNAYKHHKTAVLANRDALSTLEKSIRKVMETSHPTAAAIETMRSRFIAAAEGMHVSHSAAVALASKLLGVKAAANAIPGSRRIFLYDNTSTVRGHIASLQASINQLHGKTVTINYIETVHRTLQAERARATGGYVGLAEGGMPRRRYPVGGPVSGPGTATSDSIPAMLSNGEYVINAEQTKRYLPLLDAINYKLDGFAAGGFAKGGKPKPPTKAQKAAGVKRVALAKARPEYLAAIAAQKSLESMRASIYGGMFRGGKSTPGSAHGSVVQHTTNLTVNVQGSVTTVNKLATDLQSIFLRNGVALTLPAGR